MIKLKSEFLMPPIKTGFCTKEGFVTDKFINYYRRRAEYTGAITFEPFFIDMNAKELPTQVGIDDDDKLEGLRKLNAKIHEYDTKTIAHINHPGRMANPMIPTNRWLSSSDIACENGGAQPKAMDENDMEEVIKLFTDASVRAEKAGFDIIELQFGHGYLLGQFLSPLVNKRTDEYGGSFENRVKFPLRVLDTVQKAVNLPIIARISGEEMVPGGLKLDEMIKLSKILESKGVEAIHVSAGTICSTPPWFFQHMYVPKGKTWEYASEIQKNIGIPVIYVGKINTFEDINMLNQNTGAKYFAVGRALLADPDFIGKYLGKIDGNYKPCSACAEGCLGGVKSGNGLSCVVNPLVGNDFVTIEKAGIAKILPL